MEFDTPVDAELPPVRVFDDPVVVELPVVSDELLVELAPPPKPNGAPDRFDPDDADCPADCESPAVDTR
jgi:hypothetical protein